MRVLVLGGGVIGASAAYRLAVRGAEVTVVERSAVACAASGKSGGFLALDWCDGTPLMQLARRSFALHAELADDLGGDWGYRRMTTYAGVVGPHKGPHLIVEALRLARLPSVRFSVFGAPVWHYFKELGESATKFAVDSAKPRG